MVKAGQAAPKKFKDFRQLLEQKDINAVIIGTPDHWHALTFIAACEAGKDIYCEKPISHNLVEAKAMVGAARHFKPVVQIGTWQRSMKHFQDAIAFVRSGQMGKINLCRAWMCYLPAGHRAAIAAGPAAGPGLGLLAGAGAQRPYQPNRCHENWRWFYNTGGSLMSDWGVHMIDIVLLAMQESDPVSVVASGGKLATNDDRDTPDTLLVNYRFPKWILNWEHRFNNPRGLDGGKEHGAEFIGDHGSLIVDRSRLPLLSLSSGSRRAAPFAVVRQHTLAELPGLRRTRSKPASDIESMAKTTIVCHLGNIAFQSPAGFSTGTPHRQDVADHGEVQALPLLSTGISKPLEAQDLQLSLPRM